MLEKEIWLKVKGRKNHWGSAVGISTVTAHTRRPSLSKDEIVMKIELAIPNSLFDEPSYTARVELPETEREIPPMAIIGDNVQKALSKAMGFKIKVQMGDEEDEQVSET